MQEFSHTKAPAAKPKFLTGTPVWMEKLEKSPAGVVIGIVIIVGWVWQAYRWLSN